MLLQKIGYISLIYRYNVLLKEVEKYNEIYDLERKTEEAFRDMKMIRCGDKMITPCDGFDIYWNVSSRVIGSRTRTISDKKFDLDVIYETYSNPTIINCSEPKLVTIYYEKPKDQNIIEVDVLVMGGIQRVP